jgi:hypothetical protein
MFSLIVLIKLTMNLDIQFNFLPFALKAKAI